MMLRLAEQNNSVTALFFIHFSKWTNVLLLAVINTINKKFTCRKICPTETATQSTETRGFFRQGTNRESCQRPKMSAGVGRGVAC